MRHYYTPESIRRRKIVNEILDNMYNPNEYTDEAMNKISKKFPGTDDMIQTQANEVYKYDKIVTIDIEFKSISEPNVVSKILTDDNGEVKKIYLYDPETRIRRNFVPKKYYIFRVI